MADIIEASEDLAGFVERCGIGPILRGAVLSKAHSVDAYFPGSLSNLSPLFKLPVDAVQRGRDHGEARCTRHTRYGIASCRRLTMALSMFNTT